MDERAATALASIKTSDRNDDQRTNQRLEKLLKKYSIGMDRIHLSRITELFHEHIKRSSYFGVIYPLNRLDIAVSFFMKEVAKEANVSLDEVIEEGEKLGLHYYHGCEKYRKLPDSDTSISSLIATAILGLILGMSVFFCKQSNASVGSNLLMFSATSVVGYFIADHVFNKKMKRFIDKADPSFLSKCKDGYIQSYKELPNPYSEDKILTVVYCKPVVREI